MALLKSGTRIYGNATIDTNLSITGNTVSSNYQSGALVVAGGVGIAGNVYINANLNALDTVITGNLTVTGTTTTVNSSTTQLEDPIIDLGNGANGTALTTNDNHARGLSLHYYNGAVQDAFMGWDTANGQFALVNNASISGGSLTINTYGDVKANGFYGYVEGIANLSQLTVNGISRLGNVGNIKITGGANGYILTTDGQGNLIWSNPASEAFGNANISGSNTQVFFNNGNSNTLGTSANFTFNSTGNVLIVDKIVANGSGLTSITGANVTGTVANATYSLNAGNAYSVTGSNVTGQVSNALIAGTVYTNAQPNITSIGTLTSLTVTGNITAGNVSGGNLVSANYFSGNGSLLSSLSGANVTGQVANALVAGTVYANAQPNITSVGNLTSLKIGNATANTQFGNGTINATGNITTTGTLTGGNITTSGNITANYIIGNAAYLSGLKGQTQSLITSNIASIFPGATIEVGVDYSNTTYPGGIFTIYQLGPVTINFTDNWYGTGASKNAYANYEASSVNTEDINVSISLANANFNLQSTDSIVIGSSTITGANLIALNITGNGTYTIPNTYFSSSIQTTATSTVTLHLTTDRGQYTANGTTLTTAQPVAYSVNSITGSFPSSQVPYFNLNQSFNWSLNITGTTSTGNLTYSGGSISTTSLSSSGATSGSSGSIDSTSSYTVTTSDYYGAGLNGYGNRTISSAVNGIVSAATKYYPLFYKTTTSSANPNFSTSDTYLTHNYVLGDGASTTNNTSNWLWIAVPGTSSHTFAYTFGGFVADVTPEATYTGQTIAGYTYNVYGFTNYSAITFLYTVT
jgi:hypothetical protein